MLSPDETLEWEKLFMSKVSKNMSKPKLTGRLPDFCEEYIIDLNPTEAALRAGYSKRTAKRMGAENLAKPIVQAKIAELYVIRGNTHVAEIIRLHAKIEDMRTNGPNDQIVKQLKVMKKEFVNHVSNLKGKLESLIANPPSFKV